MADGAEDVDLGAAFPRGALAFARTTAAEASWRAIARFWELWNRAGSASREWVPFVFLEYDANGPKPPAPSVFAALDSPVGDAASRGSPELAAALEVCETLLGDAFDAATAAQLERSFGALRGEARLLHVAAMLGRERKSTRLSAWLPRAQLVGYFEALGVARVADQLEPLLALLPSEAPAWQVDFDIGPPVGTRIGVGHRPESPEDWKGLFARLVAAGLCAEAKARALLSWSKAPDSLASPLRRALSHVKLASLPAGRVEAKCYLGASRDRASESPG